MPDSDRLRYLRTDIDAVCAERYEHDCSRRAADEKRKQMGIESDYRFLSQRERK